MIEIFVNGECKQVDAAATVAASLQQWSYACERIAVAINSEFLPRAEYQSRRFSAGDKVDIVAPVAGG